MSTATLNDDVLREIFLRLPVLERVRIRPVCKQWRRVSDDCWRSVKAVCVEDQRDGSTIEEAVEDNGYLCVRSANEHFILGLLYCTSKYIEGFCDQPGNFSIIRGLKKCRKLQNLSITLQSASDHYHLRQLLAVNPRIEVLQVELQNDQCLTSLSTEFLETLTIVERSERILGATLRKKLRQCRLIEELKIYAKIDDETAEVISGLQSLKSLSVTVSSVEAENCIAKLRNLEQIEIAGSITNEFFSKLSENCINLETIELGCSTVTDEGLQSLKFFPHLQALNIKDGRITGTCFVHFRRISCLFISSSVPIVDEHAAVLFRNSRLRYLFLGGSQTTMDAVHVALEEVVKRENNQATTDNILQLKLDHLDDFMGPLPRVLHKFNSS